MKNINCATRFHLALLSAVVLATLGPMPLPAHASSPLAPASYVLPYPTLNVHDCSDPDNKLVIARGLGIEEYVKDVLPNEWGRDWDYPSLRSGAIAARTWAQAGENHYEGWDSQYGQYVDGVCSNGQVYIAGSHYWKTDNAVNDTSSIIMTYNGSPINAQHRGYPLRGNWTDHWVEEGYPYLFSVGDAVSYVTFSPNGQGRLPNGLNESCQGSYWGCPGESQNGSHQWEQGDYKWNEWQILSHYYTGANFENGGPTTGARWIDNTAYPLNNNTGIPSYDQNSYPTENGTPTGEVFRTYSPVTRLQNTGTIPYCNQPPLQIRLSYWWAGPRPVQSTDRINVGTVPSFYGDAQDGCMNPGRYSPLYTPFSVPGVMGIYTLKWDMVDEGVYCSATTAGLRRTSPSTSTMGSTTCGGKATRPNGPTCARLGGASLLAVASWF